MQFPAPNLKQYEQSTNKTFTIPFTKSCAVVGSSGILLNSSYGDLIDQHDLVIRVGIPEVKGYETDVGRKLDITSFNHVALRNLVMEVTAPRGTPRLQTYTKRLEYLNNTILWYYLDLDHSKRQSRLLLQVLSKKCEEKGLSVHLAFTRSELEI